MMNLKMISSHEIIMNTFQGCAILEISRKGFGNFSPVQALAGGKLR